MSYFPSQVNLLEEQLNHSGPYPQRGWLATCAYYFGGKTGESWPFFQGVHRIIMRERTQRRSTLPFQESHSASLSMWLQKSGLTHLTIQITISWKKVRVDLKTALLGEWNERCPCDGIMGTIKQGCKPWLLVMIVCLEDGIQTDGGEGRKSEEESGRCAAWGDSLWGSVS